MKVIGIAIALLLAGFVQGNMLHGPNGGDDKNPLLGKRAPEFAEGNWINSQPLTMAGLKGKVVLVEFWTFECYNCKNTLPHVITWSKKFAGSDFTVIGVHTPELDIEKDLKQVKSHVESYGISYPVVTDNDYKTWNAYSQEYWPVIYLIDKQGIIRYVHVGEGDYEKTEETIQELLKEQS